TGAHDPRTRSHPGLNIQQTGLPTELPVFHGERQQRSNTSRHKPFLQGDQRAGFGGEMQRHQPYLNCATQILVEYGIWIEDVSRLCRYSSIALITSWNFAPAWRS